MNGKKSVFLIVGVILAGVGIRAWLYMEYARRMQGLSRPPHMLSAVYSDRNIMIFLDANGSPQKYYYVTREEFFDRWGSSVPVESADEPPSKSLFSDPWELMKIISFSD